MQNDYFCCRDGISLKPGIIVNHLHLLKSIDVTFRLCIFLEISGLRTLNIAIII